MNIKNKVAISFQTLILIFALAMIVFTLYQNITNKFFTRLVVLCIVAAIVAAFVIYRIRIKDHYILLAIILLSFILRLTCILILEPPVRSDFAVIQKAGADFMNGNWSAFKVRYFRVWGYQIPFSLYEGIIYKLFGSIFAIKLLNLFYMLATNILIYKTAALFVSNRAALTAAFLYAVYPDPILLAPVLTNQHLSGFLIYLGIYIFLSKDQIRWRISAGIILAAGNLMRPEGIVAIASILVAGLLLLIKNFSKNSLKLFLKRTALVVAVYFVFLQSVAFLLKLSDITPNGIGNNCPEWKFVVGLDTESTGLFSKRNAYFQGITDPEQRRSEMIKIIKASFKQCDNIPDFFYNKTMMMWGEPENLYWSVGHISKNSLVFKGTSTLTYKTLFRWIQKADKAVYLTAFIAFLLSVLLLFKRKKVNDKLLLFICMLCANYTIYLFIEIQSRYKYFIMPALFIAGAMSFDLFGKLPLFQKRAKPCANTESKDLAIENSTPELLNQQ